MVLANAVGILLAAEAERALLGAAVRECGMEPVYLSTSATESRTVYEQANSDPGATGPSEGRSILLVTDQPIERNAADGFGEALRDRYALVIPVCDAVSEEEDSLASGTHSMHPWVLRRPLQSEDVRTLLLEAARASKFFAQRSHSLTEELHRTRSILDSMSNGVTVSDATQPDLPLIYVNPAFERITGYLSQEVCGRNCRFLQGEETDQTGVEEVRAAIRERRDLRVLLRNFRKDGTAFWNELYMSPVWATSGELTHFVGFQNDVTARVESAERIKHLAHHDGLTGLANRAFMMERLEHALIKAERNEAQVAVLFFDLDRFKGVNDVFGHEAGDRLLQTVAQRLLACTRKDETVARIGGDEFVVVLEGIREELQALEVLRRLQSRLSQPYDLCGEPFHPAASVGMTLFLRDGLTPEALLKTADGKMYQAKRHSHRNEEQRDLIAAPAS